MFEVVSSPAAATFFADALVAGLGWVNAVRFLQPYEASRFDYTEERHRILPDWDAKTIGATSTLAETRGSEDFPGRDVGMTLR